VRPLDWYTLVKFCESKGCRLDREKGDHYIMVKPGLARPIVIPKKRDLGEDIVLSVIRTLGLNRKALEEYFDKAKKNRTKPIGENAIE
jgi:predicted RNA binding protein YcfA (HicA-like mRNA interferase family)